MRWDDVLFIDGAISYKHGSRMSIAVWNGGKYSHIFNYSGGAEESDARWQDIEIVIETHEYLMKIYFHRLLELNLICINFFKKFP